MFFPGVVVLAVLTVFPLIYSLALSFNRWNLEAGSTGWSFMGAGNYLRAFTDPDAVNAFEVTGIYIAGVIAAELVFGLLIALLLNRQIYGVGLVRTAIMLPMMTTPVVVGLIWRLMFNTDIGWLNYLLSLLGIGKIDWLGMSSTALLSVGIAEVWEWTPFVILVLLAALQSMPTDRLEAAHVDGASAIQAFRYIVFPYLLPALAVCALLRTIDTIKFFDLFYVLTRGGPGTSTEVISLYTYKEGFKFFDLGYASALSYLMLIVIILLANVMIFVARLRQERQA